MVAALLAFTTFQESGLPQRPDYGKYESLTLRPYRRDPEWFVKLSRRVGGGAERDNALLSALDWLGRYQADDGSWASTEDGSRVEVTGLALLAHLGAGFTTWSQEQCRFAQPWRFGGGTKRGPSNSRHVVVRRAVAFLLRSQDSDGFIGPRSAPNALRTHAIAATALSEAWGYCALLALRDPAERAIQALAQEPLPDADDALLGWAGMAFRSAALGGFPVSRSVGDRLIRKSSATTVLGTAVDLYLWVHASRRDRSDRVSADFQWLLERRPAWEQDRADLDAWLWGTLAVYRYDGPEGPMWKRWNQALLEALLRNQQTALEDLRGSWEPIGVPARRQGRAYACAVNALTLSAGYQPLFYSPR
jgi:hypothetical protein